MTFKTEGMTSDEVMVRLAAIDKAERAKLKTHWCFKCNLMSTETHVNNC